MLFVACFTLEAESRFPLFICLGHDLMSLLYHFMDEFLFVFSAEPFFIARVSTREINVHSFNGFLLIKYLCCRVKSDLR